jgi:hypothetical protein
MFMIRMARQNNIVDPGSDGRRTEREQVQMFEAMRDQFNDMREPNPTILQTSEFIELSSHLASERHLRETSPRFECLRGALL